MCAIDCKSFVVCDRLYNSYLPALKTTNKKNKKIKFILDKYCNNNIIVIIIKFMFNNQKLVIWQLNASHEFFFK